MMGAPAAAAEGMPSGGGGVDRSSPCSSSPGVVRPCRLHQPLLGNRAAPAIQVRLAALTLLHQTCTCSADTPHHLNHNHNHNRRRQPPAASTTTTTAAAAAAAPNTPNTPNTSNTPRRSHFRQMYSFEDADPRDLQAWKQQFMWVMRKVGAVAGEAGSWEGTKHASYCLAAQRTHSCPAAPATGAGLLGGRCLQPSSARPAAPSHHSLAPSMSRAAGATGDLLGGRHQAAPHQVPRAYRANQTAARNLPQGALPLHPSPPHGGELLPLLSRGRESGCAAGPALARRAAGSVHAGWRIVKAGCPRCEGRQACAPQVFRSAVHMADTYYWWAPLRDGQHLPCRIRATAAARRLQLPAACFFPVRRAAVLAATVGQPATARPLPPAPRPSPAPNRHPHAGTPTCTSPPTAR